MFRRENKNLGKLREAVQTWLNSYERLNNEAKRANRNALIDPTTLRGNVGLIKAIRKYAALKSSMNQMPPGPLPPTPQVNRAAVNTQMQRFERNIQTALRTQAANANKLAQLTRIQTAIGQFQNQLKTGGGIPSNLLNKFSQFNRAITAARNGLGTPRGSALVQQAVNKLAVVAKDVSKGDIYKTPKGVFLVAGVPGNATGRIIPNAYYKVIEGRNGAWNWSVNNRAFNYNRSSGNIRPKTSPALPPRPGPPALPPRPNKNSKANTLLLMYPNNRLSTLNTNELIKLRQNLMSLGLGVTNRQNVGNKVNAISAILNQKALAQENVFSRL
jgi:hypothetical protein